MTLPWVSVHSFSYTQSQLPNHFILLSPVFHLHTEIFKDLMVFVYIQLCPMHFSFLAKIKLLIE